MNVTSNPEYVRRGQEQLQGILVRSATDLEFRQKLITDSRAAVAEFTGQDIPEGFNIQFVENTADATFVLPNVVDPNGELSDMELEAVAGGELILLCLAAAAAGVALGGAIASIVDHYN